jgi:imidazoleglycerol-phosphate dehydratase
VSERADRSATVERSTRETSIRLTVHVDEPASKAPSTIDVPDGFFGHMLEALAVHGGLHLDVHATGDTHVDLHHTVEDTGIVLGQALREALGERRGIRRFAHAYAPLDEALARAVVDVSGRGFFVYRADPGIANLFVKGDFPVSLTADFFHALADNAKITLHLDLLAARNGHHAVEAAFKAVAVALRRALEIRSGAGAVPSTKGVLA